MIVCRLGEILKQRGWSNRKLAQETGLSPNVIGNVTRAYSIVSLLSLAKICQVLQLTPGDVLELQEK